MEDKEFVITLAGLERKWIDPNITDVKATVSAPTMNDAAKIFNKFHKRLRLPSTRNIAKRLERNK